LRKNGSLTSREDNPVVTAVAIVCPRLGHAEFQAFELPKKIAHAIRRRRGLVRRHDLT
jgi:hypothetical protein